jgi:DNA-binding MarR family transcriptional regulator
MKADVIKELGHLALGTRLKRLGERLQAQTQVVLEGAGIGLPASHFPILAGLDRLGQLSVGEIAEAVGMSQPGVTRMLDKLQSDGLVRSATASDDKRVRTIALTAAGEKLVASSKRTVWPLVESAVAEACAGKAESLLPALAALEQALLDASLNSRADRLRTIGKSRARA